METLSAYPVLTQSDFRAQLHQVIDQIQDEAVLRAALLLLLPQTALEAPEPALSPAWQQELARRLAAHDPAKNIPFAEVMDALTKESV